jgi:twitching motility protein PilT
MPDTYDLTRILEEIIEDEKVGASKRKKISQADIKKMLVERHKAPLKIKQPDDMRLGQMLIQESMISPQQLEEALKIQVQKGGKIGSILVELGYLLPGQLLEFLGKQFGVPSGDLFQLNISQNLSSLVPSRIRLKYRVLPLKAEGGSLSLAMEDPNDQAAIHEVEFLTGYKVQPVIVPSYQMNLAIKCLEENGGKGFSGAGIQTACRAPLTIEAMLQYTADANGSDLLITAGVPPSVKVQNTLERSDMPALDPEQCVAYGKALMTEPQWEGFLRRKQLDFAIECEGVGRFRVSAYRQKNSISMVFRRILKEIPSFETLGLPLWLEDFTARPQGLILVTAPPGHGKTTTISAMVDMINEKRHRNIITLEDPIEYVHKPKRSNINQREVGADATSYTQGLRSVFRQAPDVIMVGEMHDEKSFEIALRAASAGHLVLSSLCASNSTAAIDSMVNRFPDHLRAQVRQQLADTLLLIFAQRLLPRKGSKAMALAFEKLINSRRVRDFIRKNEIHPVRTELQTEFDDYSSIDVSLSRLVKDGKIALENALLFADTTEYVRKMSQ